MDHRENSSFTMNSSRVNDTSAIDALQCLLPFHVGIVMVCINIVMGIVGTVGNLLVVLAVYFTPALRTISNKFICSLALADLLVTMCGQPLLAVLQLGRTSAQCLVEVELVFRLVGNFSCAVSFLNLCFVSIDRCVAILKPLQYKNLMTTRKLRAMLSVVWLLPAIYTVLRLTIKKKVTSYFTVLMFAVGYVTILICYCIIFATVWRQGTKRQSLQSSSRKGTQSRSHEAEKRLAKTLAVVIGVFTVAWAPMFYLRMRAPDKNYGTAYNWARTVAMSSSAFNPIIYCFRNVLYRGAFRNIITCSYCSNSRIMHHVSSLRSSLSSSRRAHSKSSSSVKAV